METYSIANNFLSVKIKRSGAELASIQSTTEEIEYLWEADPQYWGRHSSILFPIVGKVFENTYHIDGRSYNLNQHGFARNMPFELLEQSDSSISLVLEHSEESRQVYPYHFRFIARYTVKDREVSIQYQIENTDQQIIYFSVGAHPAFRVPLSDGEKRADYSLVFEQKETADRHLIDQGYRTGQTERVLLAEKEIPIEDHLFEKDALIFKDLVSDQIALCHNSGKKIWTFSFKDFPYLGIWSKNEASPFVCIEPWFGVADKMGGYANFKQKEGILHLGKGEKFECEHKILIH